MGRRLRMSAEIGGWLADLRSSQPGVAAEVGAALATVLDSDNVAGLAFVTDLGTPAAIEPGDRIGAVDAAYQQLLASLQLLRQQAAQAGSLAELIAHTERWQGDVDALRAGKEAAKARYTAASATRDIQRALIESGHGLGQAGLDLEGQPDTSEARQADAELAAAEQALGTASCELSGLLAEAARLRRAILSELSDDGSTPDSEPGITAGLLELRVCPFAADIRLLCAMEPAGTLTLLAVLEGEAAVSSHRTRAIGLAGELLAEVRDEGWPAEVGEVAFADTATFLQKSFPHLGGYISARSAALRAATTIAGLRRHYQLSLTDVAAAAGLSESALWELQTNDLRFASLDDVAAYVQALGGRLELTVDLGDGHPRLLF